jgi:hypothetical protein
VHLPPRSVVKQHELATRIDNMKNPPRRVSNDLPAEFFIKRKIRSANKPLRPYNRNRSAYVLPMIQVQQESGGLSQL